MRIPQTTKYIKFTYLTEMFFLKIIMILKFVEGLLIPEWHR